MNAPARLRVTTLGYPHLDGAFRRFARAAWPDEAGFVQQHSFSSGFLSRSPNAVS